MSDTVPNTTGTQPQVSDSRPTAKQLQMVNSLLGQLRPYYAWPAWKEIEETIFTSLQTTGKKECSKLIQQLIEKLSEKHAEHPNGNKNTPVFSIPL